MICETCKHKEICTYKEDFNTLKKSATPYKLDDPFIIEIRCRHFKSTVTKGTLDGWQMP